MEIKGGLLWLLFSPGTILNHHNNLPMTEFLEGASMDDSYVKQSLTYFIGTRIDVKILLLIQKLSQNYFI